MRILDEDKDRALEKVSLYLTRSEAMEMKDALELLLKDPTKHHEHVLSDDYRKEITICIYDERVLDQFDERSKKLIVRDD